MAVVSVAVIAIGIAGSGGHRFVSPGPVGSQHGPIEEDCQSCHSSGGGGPAHWFGGAFGGGEGLSESHLCQQCHDLGTYALLPHSVEPSDLAKLTDAAAGSDASGRSRLLHAVALLGPGVPRADDGSITCATCHHEHRGRDFDLQALGDRQCQICHERKFPSFGSGHPNFSAYPYVRRTRIRFGHAVHQKEHFAASQQGVADEDKAEFACRSCHQPGHNGQVMLVSGFEENCASCHQKDVEAAEGIPFLQLPGIDIEALRDAGIQVGEWPLYADIDQLDPFAPFLRILLAADPANAAAFDALPGNPSELVFAELDYDEDQAQAVGQLVWAVKDLLHELSVERQPGLKAHLDSGLRRTMGEAELATLSANFDFDLVVEATRAWFPNLAAEIAAQRGHRESAAAVGGSATGFDLNSIPTRELDTPELATREPVWGWRIDPDTFAIRYRPKGHTDPFMKRWLEVVTDPAEHTTPAAMAYALDALGATEADGHCAKCHSVDITENLRVVNWQQKRRDLRKRGFTRYMHQPHLIQPDLADCVACHQMKGARAEEELAAATDGEGVEEIAEEELAQEPPDEIGEEPVDEIAEESAEEPVDEFAEEPNGHPREAASYAEGFTDRDPRTYSSDFAPLDHNTCQGCHQPGGARDGCLNCHNYHVNPAVLMGAQSHIEGPLRKTADSR